MLKACCVNLALVQVETLKTEIEKVRKVLSNESNESVEAIRAAAGDMQKASLKLFERAYKKVCV